MARAPATDEAAVAFARMKWPADDKSSPTMLELDGSPRGYLRPLAASVSGLDPAHVRLIAEWRNEHADAFLTEISATVESTTSWIVETIGEDPSRILFMAVDADGHPYGHLGLIGVDWKTRRGELDAVVRGVPGPSGLMARAVARLLRWASESLGLQSVCLRVRSDNSAIGFYRRLGFVETGRTPLRRMVVMDRVEWVEDPGGGGNLAVVYMQYSHRTEDR